MSYIRNGQRIFTAQDKTIRKARQYDSYSIENIYRHADHSFSLNKHNVDLQTAYFLGHCTLSDVRDEIRWIQCDIAQRRFEMFQTLQYQHDHIAREGVSASGNYRDRQAWMYYNTAKLKFFVACAQRIGLDTSWL